MTKYRKKPVVIEAFKWTGGPDQAEDPEWIVDAIKRGDVYYQGGDKPYLTIETLEGKMRANVGDYIIKGVKGEIYPCREDIFLATYEPESFDDVTFFNCHISNEEWEAAVKKYETTTRLPY